MPTFLPSLADVKSFASNLNILNSAADTGSGQIPQPSNTAERSREVSSPSVQPTERPSYAAATTSMAKRSTMVQSEMQSSSFRLAPRPASVVIMDAGRQDLRGDANPRNSIDAASAPSTKMAKTVRGRPLSVGSVMTDRSLIEKRRRKPQMDTYIIVKPPATAAKNPLNLQIQLVVRSQDRLRDRSSSTDTAYSVDSSATPLEITESKLSQASSATMLPKRVPSPSSGTVQAQGVGQQSYAVSSNTPEAPEASGSSLRRAGSSKSNYSSSTSASSFGPSSRKRVEPMFNLTVHNVMQPTVVTDAATDAKVAKFHKRNVEIVGLGVLEPAEVRTHSTRNPRNSLKPPNSSSIADHHLHPSMFSGSTATASRSSSLSRHKAQDPRTKSINGTSSDNPTTRRASLDLSSLHVDAANQEGRTRQLFGRLFRKKVGDDQDSQHLRVDNIPSKDIRPDSPALALTRQSTRSSISAGRPSLSAHQLEDNATNENGRVGGQALLGPPTFGTSPLVISRRSSSSMPDSRDAPALEFDPVGKTPMSHEITSSPLQTTSSRRGTPRPSTYTWTVTKWSKRKTDNWASNLVAIAAASLDAAAGNLQNDIGSVTFQWEKQESSSDQTQVPLLQSKSHQDTESASGIPALSIKMKNATPDLDSNASTPSSSPPFSSAMQESRRASTDPDVSTPTSASDNDRTDASSFQTAVTREDSDVEDCETPWACYLTVGDSSERRHLGTLTPAVHHPKVIAVLKMPVSLEPLSASELRSLKPDRSPKQTTGPGNNEIVMGEENLKDVICVTAMWVVAREEFGGLGRRKRQ